MPRTVPFLSVFSQTCLVNSLAPALFVCPVTGRRVKFGEMLNQDASGHFVVSCHQRTGKSAEALEIGFP